MARDDVDGRNRNLKIFCERFFYRTVCATILGRFFHGNRKGRIKSRYEIFHFLDQRAFRAGFCENKDLHVYKNKRASRSQVISDLIREACYP